MYFVVLTTPLEGVVPCIRGKAPRQQTSFERLAPLREMNR